MLVLALGIGGVMTQFTVVNAFVLRGFSFPHPEQLISVGLIDPKGDATKQQLRRRAIFRPRRITKTCKAAQRSFAIWPAISTDRPSTSPINNNPQRYTGGYVTEDFFKIIGVSPVTRSRFQCRR